MITLYIIKNNSEGFFGCHSRILNKDILKVFFTRQINKSFGRRMVNKSAFYVTPRRCRCFINERKRLLYKLSVYMATVK